MVQADSGASQPGLRSPEQGSKSMHTPTPWTVDCAERDPEELLFWIDGDCETISVCDLYYRHSDGTFYSKENAKANASRIVHCVNLHDELVEALERCVEWIESDEAAHGRTFGAGVQARTVLKKARGEE